MPTLAHRSMALLVGVLLVASSCSSGTSDETVPDSETIEGTTTAAPSEQSASEDEPVATTVAAAAMEDVTECEDSVEEFAFGSMIESELPTADGSKKLYYCVEVPVGVEEFTVELTGLSGNLDLYLGFPDLATLTDGGFGLKYSTASGTTDEWVTVDVDPDLIWSPGAYYIEVSGLGGESSTFTLTAREL